MAEKLDTSKAWLPKPTEGLFRQMAKTSRECLLAMMDELGVELPAEAKDEDTWYFVARQAYCTLARIGGAKAVKIEEEATS
jgi:hypothetical protein